MGNIFCCGCIRSSQIGIIERFGKYHKVVTPGLYWKYPIIDDLKYTIVTRKKQVKINVDTKTSDNVFCNVAVSVIYSVKHNEIYSAVYDYWDFEELVNSYVQNEVRSELTRITLDEAFLQKQTISEHVKKALKENISFGYHIHDVLINDVEPDGKVREAMNEINTQQRIRLAKQEKADAYRLEIISKAESDAKASEINGLGFAKTKSTIISGLREAFPNLSDAELAQLVLTSEQLNMMKSLDSKSTVFIPYDSLSKNLILNNNIL